MPRTKPPYAARVQVGPRDAGGGFGLGATEPFQGGLFLAGQQTKGILLGTGQRKTPRETRQGSAPPCSHSAHRKAIFNTSDPLVGHVANR